MELKLADVLDKKIIPNFDGVSVPELDKKIEDNVLEHERAERLICFGLLEMDDRKGHEKFGYGHITDYDGKRFDYSDRNIVGGTVPSLPIGSMRVDCPPILFDKGSVYQ